MNLSVAIEDKVHLNNNTTIHHYQKLTSKLCCAITVYLRWSSCKMPVEDRDDSCGKIQNSFLESNNIPDYS